MKILHLICILFLFNCLNILIDEGKEIIYRLEEKSMSFSRFLCVKLSIIFQNRTQINLKEINKELYKIIIKKSNGYNNYNSRKALNDTLENQNSKFFIIKNYLCLTYNNKIFSLNLFYKNVFFLIDEESYEFKITKYDFESLLNFETLIILRKDDLYSNCSKSFYREKCLIDCIKKSGLRNSKYYFKSGENKTIFLKYNDNKAKIYEKRCTKKCNKHLPCKLIKIKSTFKLDNNSPRTLSYRPEFAISKFDWLIQLFSLFALFLNISFYQIISVAAKYFNSRFNNFAIKNYFIFIINLLLCFISYAYLLKNYFDEIENPIKNEISLGLLTVESLNLAFCLQINYFIDPYYYRQENITYFELEKWTPNKLNKSFLKFYISDQMQQEVEWTTNSNVLFYRYFRCYQLHLNLKKNDKKQNLLINTEIKIVTPFESIFFLVSEGQILNSESSYLHSSYNYVKRIIKKSKLKRKCLDYRDAKLKCLGFQDCVDKCFTENFVSIYDYYNPERILNKDHLSKDSWIKIKAVKENSNVYKDLFNISLVEKIEKECRKKFLPDCSKIYYMRTEKLNQLSDLKTTKINLQMEVISYKEEEASIYILLMNLLNIQSILFNLNLFKLAELIFYWLRIRFKFKKILIYSIFLFFSSYHLLFIFREIVNGDLLITQYYRLERFFNFPVFYFCVLLDRTLINSNFKLSYNYFNEVTKDIKIEHVIEKIEYLNSLNNWSIINQSSNIKNELTIYSTYLLNKKCFTISSNELKYDRDQFDYQDNTIVLKVFFNKNVNEVEFFTRARDSSHFTKIKKLSAYLNFFHNVLYTIAQENFEINYNDKFSLIKDLFLDNENNQYSTDDAYPIDLIDEFKRRFHLQTLNIPVNSPINKLSDLEIDDDLHMQFHENIQNRKILNRNKEVALNNIDMIEYFSKFEFTNSGVKFSANYLKKVINVENKDNFVKLILSLLNLLSLWFGHSILEFSVLFLKLRIILVYFCRFLLKLQKDLIVKIQEL